MTSAIPSARERSCARSYAGHGRMEMPNVSGASFAVLLTNADPDAVKGACELQRMHCPATIHSSDGVHTAERVGSSALVQGDRKRCPAAIRFNSRDEFTT